MKLFAKIITLTAALVLLGGALAFADGCEPPNPSSYVLKVTIPSCEVVFNGVSYDSAASEYPILVYNNMTYIPLSWNLTRFLGLKTYDYSVDRSTAGAVHNFYVGSSRTRADSLELSPRTSDNTGELTASLPTKSIYTGILYDWLSPEDNRREEYPFISFRGIIYMPMTWHYTKEIFDWDCSFDAEKGWTVNTVDAVRPEQTDDELRKAVGPGERHFVATWTNYVYGDGCYAGFPSNAYGNYEFVWCERLGEEKRFDMQEEVINNDLYFFNCVNNFWERNGYREIYSGGPPLLDGSVLTIYCVPYGGRETKLVKIDLDKQKVISVERVPGTVGRPNRDSVTVKGV